MLLYKTKTLAKFVENRKCYHPPPPLLLPSRIMSLLLWKDSEGFRSDFEGSPLFVLLVGFCTKLRPWPNSLKTANIIDRSPLLLQGRIMFDQFSSEFKTILHGSSFLSHPSSVFILYPPRIRRQYRNFVFQFFSPKCLCGELFPKMAFISFAVFALWQKPLLGSAGNMEKLCILSKLVHITMETTPVLKIVSYRNHSFRYLQGQIFLRNSDF